MTNIAEELFGYRTEVKRLEAEIERLRAVEAMGAALIADVRRRYPGEELRCEFMQALDAALKDTKP